MKRILLILLATSILSACSSLVVRDPHVRACVAADLKGDAMTRCLEARS